MALDTAFRLSFYVTLGLACACVSQAETFFQGWFPYVFLPLAVVVFILAWRFEGRWVISETASNYLGIFIGLASVGWILLQLPRSDEDLFQGGVPWPAGLLPHLAPLILVLLAVKLFRPKRLADFWVIHTIALMLVTLGCVLAGDPLFALLLLCYLFSLLWCLALFHLYRARHAGGPTPLFAATRESTIVVPWRWLGARRVLAWSAPVLLMGMILFALLPRAGDSNWVPQKLSSAAAKPVLVNLNLGMDASRVGTVELSPEPAFHVFLEGGKVLTPDQLWRTETLDHYARGRWTSWSLLRQGKAPPVLNEKAPEGGIIAIMPAAVGILDLGGTTPIVPSSPPQDGQPYQHLQFAVQPAKAGGLVLAEPLDLRYVGIEARIGATPTKLALFYAVRGGDSCLSYMPQRRSVYRYEQFVPRAGDPEWLPARSFDATYRDYLLDQPVPEGIGAWVRTTLTRLSSLSSQERALDDVGHVAPIHHAAVSKALCRHFARSGEFTYTLNLKRHNSSIDPTVDFLHNVKAGHCERYAGALALSLRSLGIASRVIRGYRGADEEEAGKYVVRGDQAHSWVQVLVEDAEARYWLTLDPTPGDGNATSPLGTWLDWIISLGTDDWWNSFVLNYNSEVQSNTVTYLWLSLTQNAHGRGLLWQVPVAMVLLGLIGVGWRRRAWLLAAFRFSGRTAAHHAPRPGFYAQLLHVLECRLNLRPAVGQTPLEFAAVAASVLRQGSATTSLAGLPAQVAHALYRVRFAGQALNTSEVATLGRELAKLDAALAR